MRIIGNLLWWLFGGLEAAIGYFTGSLALLTSSLKKHTFYNLLINNILYLCVT